MVMNLSAALVLAAGAAAPAKYELPPPALIDLVDAAPSPTAHLSPDRRWLALVERPSLPPLSELAQPELRLAGLRIDPRASAPSRRETGLRVLLRPLPDGDERAIADLPAGARIFSVAWAPDGSRLAVVALEEGEAPALRLFLVEPRAGAAVRASDARLNAAAGTPCRWLPDATALICLTVPRDRGIEPARAVVPAGPIVQQSAKRKAAARTFQDLLKSPHDEDLLDHHLRAQIVRVEVAGGTRPIGAPATHLAAIPSMDGSVLFVRTLHRPYSYRVPLERFPQRLQLWTQRGELVREVRDLPLREEVPVAFDAVPEGPRQLHFRDDADASLCWVEARDGGDPARASEIRDELLCLDSPRAEQPRSIARLGLRFAEVRWGSGALALVEEHWWQTRRTRTWVVSPAGSAPPRLLFDRSSEDRYAHPGHAWTRPNGRGGRVLQTSDDGRSLYLEGDGASPDGDYPFLDKLDLASGKSERLWRCAGDVHEVPIAFLDRGQTLLTRRESKREPPNLFLRTLATGVLAQLTHHLHPAPALAKVDKRLLKYKRKDGVDLTATLYLPAGHDPASDGRLPLLMWIYPHEFKSAAAAGQVRKSRHAFVRPNPSSALFALLLGYAVLEDPALPIVGEGSREPNDTYVEQLVAGAQAAVDEVVRLGVADRARIAVGGHSYGAFTTANLLAHTRLFRAGIARSGAYNRTLTPFGFQQEQRTYWQVPGVYTALSPFDHADRIEAPLLLIHGEADNNPGTFPLQSERLYDAIKGLGGTARLVLLPHESHGYRGRESVLHMLWEMSRWLEAHVKQPTAAPATVGKQEG